MLAAGIEEASGQGGAPLVTWPGRVVVPSNQFTLDDEVMEQVALEGPLELSCSVMLLLTWSL